VQRIRSRSSRWSSSLVLLLLAFTTACDDAVSGILQPDPEAADALVTRTAMPPALALGEVSTVASFDAFSGEFSESIAVDRFGNIYVSMSGLGEIWQLDPSGALQEVVATFPTDGGGPFGVSGLGFDTRGQLYATNPVMDPDSRGVWKILANGARERIAGTDGIALPNDVAFAPDGTLYITDSSGAVWRVPGGGSAEMWVQDETLVGTGAYGLPFPIGANGIVVIPGRGASRGLMVANSEKGQLVHVPILPDGSAGQPTVVVAAPILFGLDGITMDARGTIYGASNAGNRVLRISRDGSDLAEIVPGAWLDFPTALTFSTGNDGHTLFVVNSAFIHLLTDPPTLGEARPGVIAVPVNPPGLH
jgi:sugar lactone lactonase YvrE